MKRFNFNNKPMVESPYPPQNINVLWVDVDESTGKVGNIKLFNSNSGWNIILSNKVNSSDKPVPKDKYLTFTAEEDNSSVGLAQIFSYHSLEYSTDQTTWNTFDTTTTVTLSKKGDKMYVRGILPERLNLYDCTKFTMTGKIAASGNCNALWNYEDLSAPLKDWCGCYLFSDCTSLTTAPELPATTVSSYCYERMFEGCTSLTTAPELPATTLSYGCYQHMFEGCTGLTQAPELPTTTLAQACYYSMFNGCTSLTTAPELPATELFDSCYLNMFKNCTALTKAPELPATASVAFGYKSMFEGCTSLKELTILLMSYINTDNIDGMLEGVATNGTLYKHPDSTIQWEDIIPDTWTILNAEI